MSKDYVSHKQILQEIQVLAGAITSLTRHVDRMDQRLVKVEGQLVKVQGRLIKVEGRLIGVDEQFTGIYGRLSNIERHTNLIPEIIDTLGNFSIGLDDHERRIKKLEKSTA